MNYSTENIPTISGPNISIFVYQNLIHVRKVEKYKILS